MHIKFNKLKKGLKLKVRAYRENLGVFFNL